MRHVPRVIIAIAGELVIRQSGDAEILGGAFGDSLRQQVAPGIIAVAVAPIFSLVIYCGRIAADEVPSRSERLGERLACPWFSLFAFDQIAMATPPS
jgi:hypothetical protein